MVWEAKTMKGWMKKKVTLFYGSEYSVGTIIFGGLIQTT
jgi:hypothetical protein